MSIEEIPNNAKFQDKTSLSELYCISYARTTPVSNFWILTQDTCYQLTCGWKTENHLIVIKQIHSTEKLCTYTICCKTNDHYEFRHAHNKISVPQNIKRTFRIICFGGDLRHTCICFCNCSFYNGILCDFLVAK